ncbi:Sigma factor regulator N-terminal [Carnobacterium iners]|uniref:Sigma factor regulator N-terminal n=1 Tax=Carnobacterium iners TaxID=1073423 RepID=A0A1X7MVE2_9LACT|nr:sigma factor regulator N-terminal domain-containing protein [Carnobacterium iners]SEK57866.1 Sigma factor regulator N-terminal [Carnobacterium iners]SMH28087.1 Sigma factor regulator N-terminal [Carnobacterium iners]
MNEFEEDIFDESKIEKAIKKGKRKTIVVIVFISIIVFFVLNLVYFFIYSYFSQQAFEQWDSYIQLSTPNGFISETIETRGFLGG